MLVYRDLLTGDELLSGSFPFKEIENGALWEVEGKFREQLMLTLVQIHLLKAVKNISVDDQASKVADIVNTFRLQEQPSFNEKQFISYMKMYIKLLTTKLDGPKQEEF